MIELGDEQRLVRRDKSAELVALDESRELVARDQANAVRNYVFNRDVGRLVLHEKISRGTARDAHVNFFGLRLLVVENIFAKVIS